MTIGIFNIDKFINSLSMNYSSVFFFVLLFFVTLFYYSTKVSHRWIVLLSGSLIFLILGGGLIVALTPILISLVAFFSSKMIEGGSKEKKGKQKKLLLSLVIISLISGLALVKIMSSFQNKINKFIFPVGISYYTFSLISYLVDIYWGKDRAEENYCKLLLFTIYFPKILQGPISRHKNLAPQLNEGHLFSFTNLSYGFQRMLWGFFKKSIIADRISILVSTTMKDYAQHGGALIVLSIALSCIQLYCDFSGCMDIAGGVSEIFGISLEKNFDRPFFATNIAEFWRKWHITLGAFFKDYVYMPLSVSPHMIKFASKIQKTFGKNTTRKIWIIIPTSVVWIMIGIWHGTGINYVIWGIYWGTLIILSALCKKKLNYYITLLHINTDSGSWKAIQIVRTFLLFLLGRIISMPSNLSDSWSVITAFFTRFNIWEIFDGTIYKLGLNGMNLHIALLSIILLFVVELIQAQRHIRDIIANWNIIIRSLVFSIADVCVIILGIWGPAFSVSNFAYMNF